MPEVSHIGLHDGRWPGWFVMAVRHGDEELVAQLAAVLMGPARDWSGLPEASRGHLVTSAVDMAQCIISAAHWRLRMAEPDAPMQSAPPEAPEKPAHHEAVAAKGEAEHLQRRRG